MPKRPEPDRCDSHSARAINASIYARRLQEHVAAGEAVEVCAGCGIWRVLCRCFELGGEG